MMFPLPTERRGFCGKPFNAQVCVFAQPSMGAAAERKAGLMLINTPNKHLLCGVKGREKTSK